MFLCGFCWVLLGVFVFLCFCVGLYWGRVGCVRAALIVSGPCWSCQLCRAVSAVSAVSIVFVVSVVSGVSIVLIMSAAADRVSHVSGMSVTSG